MSEDNELTIADAFEQALREMEIARCRLPFWYRWLSSPRHWFWKRRTLRQYRQAFDRAWDVLRIAQAQRGDESEGAHE